MFDENFILRGPDFPLPLPNISLGELCFQKLRTHPDDFVLMVEACSGRQCSSQEFLQMSVDAAASLKARGVTKGDCVCLVGRNGIQISAAAMGTLFMGAIMAPLDPSMKAFEYQHMFNLIEPRLVLCDFDVLNEINEGLKQQGSDAEVITFQDGEGTTTFQSILVNSSAEDFEPEPCEDIHDTCIIAGSSGSTGLPKGVALMHSNFIFVMSLGKAVITKFPSTTSLQTSHFFWISGIFFFLLSICETMKRILVEEVEDLIILKAIQTYKPFWCMFAPSLLHSIVQNPEFSKYDVSSMSIILTGGSPLQRATVDLVKEVWNPNMIMGQGYGLTELSAMFSAIRPDFPVESVGSVHAGVSIKVIDPETGQNLPPGEEGELCCKSYGMMKGYVKNAEATAECIDEEGWLHTGDIGYLSPQGAIYITSRIKELMKLDNHQISPAEIEQVINTVPGVADVGVAGIKISQDSSHPMALVVKLPDSDVSEEEIVKCVNENLSEFKQLRAGVVFVDKIPRTATGKIKRRLLQELADELYLGDTQSIL